MHAGEKNVSTLITALVAFVSVMVIQAPALSNPKSGPPLSLVPINDLGAGLYVGQFQGGLYEGGSNAIPADHSARGMTAVAGVVRRDTSGNPHPSGKIVLVSIGMSNTSQEFCSGADPPTVDYSRQWWAGTAPTLSQACHVWTFGGQAWADPAVEKDALEVVDGAQPGEDSASWAGRIPGYDPWHHVDTRLSQAGLSGAQVQVVWIKQALIKSGVGLATGSQGADAYVILTDLGNIVRKAKARYPNLKVAFVSSRIYGGYITDKISREPYAYETGFSAKWLVQAQITQLRGGPTDPRAGGLDLVIAPWLAWGPYLWANGTTPRSDGLTWQRADFVADGRHPSQSGEQKVGALLLAFLQSNAQSQCWLLAGRTC
jgi:hypothetical protein